MELKKLSAESSIPRKRVEVLPFLIIFSLVFWQSIKIDCQQSKYYKTTKQQLITWTFFYKLCKEYCNSCLKENDITAQERTKALFFTFL
jgi:hypothetical protein